MGFKRLKIIKALICGFLGIKENLPEFMISAVSNASGCKGPVAMLLAGFVIGGYEFKSLFGDRKVYIATLLRLIVITVIIVLSLKAIGTNKEIMTLALIAFATPLGLNTIVYPASYGGDTKTGASMAMISQSLSVVTLPLMYLFLIAGYVYSSDWRTRRQAFRRIQTEKQ